MVVQVLGVDFEIFKRLVFVFALMLRIAIRPGMNSKPQNIKVNFILERSKFSCNLKSEPFSLSYPRPIFEISYPILRFL